MAGEDLKAARLHPVAKIIAKYPLIVALIMFALYFGLAFIGAGAIEVGGASWSHVLHGAAMHRPLPRKARRGVQSPRSVRRGRAAPSG